MFRPLSELLIGLTDLPIALFSILLGMMLKKKNQKEWSSVFLLIGIAGILGATAHSLNLQKLPTIVIWCFLYPCLFESVRRYVLCFSSRLQSKKEAELPFVFVAEIICFVGALGTLVFCFEKNIDILFLVAFAAVEFVRLLLCLFRTKPLSKSALLLLILLLVPLSLQAFSAFIPYSVVAEHIFLAVELFLCARFALS